MKKVSRSFLVAVLAVFGMLLAACNGQIPAGAEVKVSADGQSATVEFSGVVNTIAADQWNIAGQTVLVNAQTVIEGTFAVGDVARVNATVDSTGAVTANKIETANRAINAENGQNPQATPGTALQGANHNNELTGKVESIAADSWTVKGQAFAVNTQTEIKGSILVGDVAKVHFVANADGTFTATEIEKAGQNQASNALGNSQPSANEVEFVGAVEAISANTWIVAGNTFAVTPQTEIKGTLSVGDLVKVHAFTPAGGILTAREIEKALPQEINGLNNPEDMKIYGVLEQVSDTQYTISGQVVLVTPQTILDSGLVVGAKVKAEVFINANGTLTAKEIETNDGDDDRSGDDNSGSGSSNSGSDDDNNSTDDNSGSGGSDDDDKNDDDNSGKDSGGDNSGSGSDD